MSTATLEEIRQSTINTEDAVLQITMPNAKLDVGGYTFRLQVTDDAGNVSQSVEVRLIVIDDQAPTGVLRITDENGQPLRDNSIGYGRSFILNASSSVDSGGGKIVRYDWSMDGLVRPVLNPDVLRPITDLGGTTVVRR